MDIISLLLLSSHFWSLLLTSMVGCLSVITIRCTATDETNVMEGQTTDAHYGSYRFNSKETNLGVNN
jgi:hypothetical protein